MELQNLFSYSTLFLSLGVAVTVATLRRPIEHRWVSLTSSSVYTKVFLPTLSVTLGAILSAFTGVLPSELVDASLVDRIIHGSIAGFFSTYVFRAAKALVSSSSETNR